jgi:ribosomal protein S18 acetylase RimI-like enzyme
MSQNGMIRLIKSSDLPALEWDGAYSHFRQVYREVYEQSRIGRTLPWVIDLPSEGIIGQLFVQLDSQNKRFADGSSRAYLFSFRIKPKFQGQGWGTRLLSSVEKDLIDRGFHWTTLKVSKLNELARQFYEHRGYAIIAEEQGEWRYVDHQGIQRVVIDPSYCMEKCLVKDRAF